MATKYKICFQILNRAVGCVWRQSPFGTRAVSVKPKVSFKNCEWFSFEWHSGCGVWRFGLLLSQRRNYIQNILKLCHFLAACRGRYRYVWYRCSRLVGCKSYRIYMNAVRTIINPRILTYCSAGQKLWAVYQIFRSTEFCPFKYISTWRKTLQWRSTFRPLRFDDALHRGCARRL